MTSRKRLLDARNGFVEYAHADGEDLTIEFVEDCEPLVYGAKMLSELKPGSELRHVAVIPEFAMQKAMQEGWSNDKEAWKRWANDVDNRCFRTWPGRL